MNSDLSNHRFRRAVFGLALAVLSLTGAQTLVAQQTSSQYLYIWASDQARVAPDFIAVIDFDGKSNSYGKIVRTVPVPPPGNVGNEAHHCSISVDQNILACGGLLSLLRNQNGIFFFDISDPVNPKFLFSTKAGQSAVTDDFFPMPNGGFLVTQMGSDTGGAPGRVAEFNGNLQFIGDHYGTLTLTDEWPAAPPMDGFNPHGITVRQDANLMLTSDFVLPSSTLNSVPGNPVLRGSVRVWDLNHRVITKTISIPSAMGTMEVKFIPNDRLMRAFTGGLFDGIIYLIDPIAGTATAVFDCDSLIPPGTLPAHSGFPQLFATTQAGDRLFFGLFQAGEVAMLDISDPTNPKVLDKANLGLNSGPHTVLLADHDRKLAVLDYFLNEDDFGKVHMEGDHKLRAFEVTRNKLIPDKRFLIDFNTAFPTGPARPHGLALKEIQNPTTPADAQQ